MDTLPDIDTLLSHPPFDESKVVEAMVVLHGAGIYRLACSILEDADEAEDAVQHALLAAALNLARYKPGTNFKAWLYTITINQCRGALRKRLARQALARLAGSCRLAAFSEMPGLEEAAQQNEEARLLWSAVNGLKEKYRLVILLRFKQGLSIEEIAQILSIPPKTVYNRLYSAYGMLRMQLGAEMAGGWPDEVTGEGHAT